MVARDGQQVGVVAYAFANRVPCLPNMRVVIGSDEKVSSGWSSVTMIRMFGPFRLTSAPPGRGFVAVHPSSATPIPTNNVQRSFDLKRP
jgi:hypothetical protein